MEEWRYSPGKGSLAPFWGGLLSGQQGVCLFCSADRLLAPGFGHFLSDMSSGSAMTSTVGVGGGAGCTPRVTARPARRWGGNEGAQPSGGRSRPGPREVACTELGCSHRPGNQLFQGPPVSVRDQEEGFTALSYMDEECAPRPGEGRGGGYGGRGKPSLHTLWPACC